MRVRILLPLPNKNPWKFYSKTSRDFLRSFWAIRLFSALFWPGFCVCSCRFVASLSLALALISRISDLVSLRRRQARRGSFDSGLTFFHFGEEYGLFVLSFVALHSPLRLVGGQKSFRADAPLKPCPARRSHIPIVSAPPGHLAHFFNPQRGRKQRPPSQLSWTK